MEAFVWGFVIKGEFKRKLLQRLNVVTLREIRAEIFLSFGLQ